MSFLFTHIVLTDGPFSIHFLTIMMGVNIAQYRASIGHFHLKILVNNIKSCTDLSYYFWSYIFLGFLTFHFIFKRLIVHSNDVEKNPGPTNNTDVPIHICHSNVRSLVADLGSNYRRLGNKPPKVVEIETLCHDNNINIMAITESWCKNTDTDNLIEINGLPKIFRRDRDDRIGGGIVVYASNDINIERLVDIEPENSEIMCFQVQLPNRINKFIFLSVCYRPNDHDIINFASDYLGLIEHTNGKGYYNFLSIGDFNTKNSEWCVSDISNMDGRIFKAFLDSNGHHQMVNFPTRFDVNNNRHSCLDYIITNEKNFISNISSYGSVANSDHIPISFNINSRIPKLKCFTRNVWNFKRGNFDRLNEKLAAYNWNTLFDSDDINNIVDKWTDIFLKMAKECIPYLQITVRPSDLPYMNTALRSKIRKRDRLFRQWKRTLRDDHRLLYTLFRNETTSALRKAQYNYITKECEKLEINGGDNKWWSTVKKLCCFKKTSNTIAPICNSDGLLIYDAESKAEIFNEFYSSVSTMENHDSPIPSNNIATGPLLNAIHISQHEVYDLLTSLDTSKATGPDNIGNVFLKKCAPSIAGILTRIFNLSLTLGEFPQKWKIAHIVPIHKKGSVHDYRMYRPVSLLPCVSKIFEKLVFKEVYQHLRRNKLISEFQSGFTPGDSTINQLIHINDRILRSLDNFDDAIGCFLDLTRAFDTVWHKGLLYKLEKYGIRDHHNDIKLYSWFSSYLTNRGHKVSIDGKISSIKYINAAVPQGSVLGPLLFLVYINDITDGIDSDIYLLRTTPLFLDLAKTMLS